jgi:hypothetical protein
MAKLAGLWADATRLDPGDGGQVAIMASNFIKMAGVRTEDAWLSALVNWSFNHPDPEARFVLASGIIRFLGIYGHSAGLSPECRDASRVIAEKLASDNSLFNPVIRQAGERLAAQERVEQLEDQRRQDAKHLEDKRRDAELLSNIRHPRPPKRVQPVERKPVQIVGRASRSDAYKLALEFLSLRLCEDGYAIQWMGECRGDVPSLIIDKGSVVFYVLLHLDIWPANTTPAPFVLQRFLEEATAVGAYRRLAKLVAFNRLAQQEHEKFEITGINIDFSFSDLETLE